MLGQDSPRHYSEVLMDDHWESYGAGMATYEGGNSGGDHIFSK
jgi:hypothetical protein